jgi:hypothetical protein
MSKKINQLDEATDLEAKNDSYLFPLADPITGVALKTSISQAKEVFGTKKIKYTALGTEGTTLTIPQLEGMDVLLILRGIGPIYESEDDSPESDEYTWDQEDIVLGAAVNLNEKFIILYRNF